MVVAAAVVVVERTSPKAESCRRRSGRVWCGKRVVASVARRVLYSYKLDCVWALSENGLSHSPPLETEESLWEFENDVTLELTRLRFDERIRN